MGLTNKGLLSSLARKEDEFYTLYRDVESVCNVYKESFKNKVIYLNTDNYLHSNIYKFFKKNFIDFKLKKLIATCYVNRELNSNDKPYKAVCENVLGQVIETVTVLDGDGDFASPECLKLLRESDIVVTNPPFSIFVDFFTCMKSHFKNYLFMTNFNTILTASIGPDFFEGKIFPALPNRVRYFEIPENYAVSRNIEKSSDGKYYERIGNALWITNLELNNFPYTLRLVKSYALNKDDYPVYDNNPDIINVNKVKDIPYDYYGKIGVPISFVFNYFGNIKENYKIVGILSHGSDNKYDLGIPEINGKTLYKRLVIQRRDG